MMHLCIMLYTYTGLLMMVHWRHKQEKSKMAMIDSDLENKRSAVSIDESGGIDALDTHYKRR